MTQQSTRALALARRKALSGAGKKADTSAASERTRGEAMQRKAKPVDQAAIRAQAGNPASAPAPVSSPSPRRATSAPVATNSSRAKALARRKAMSTSGKKADTSSDRTNDGSRNKPVAAPSTAGKAAGASAGKNDKSGGDCGCGCNGAGNCDETRGNESPMSRPAIGSRRNGSAKVRAGKGGRNMAITNPSKAASMARRQAQSSRGKAGLGAGGMSAAQTARAGNPNLTGRELAKALREQRSQRGGAGLKKSAPTGRTRPARNNGQVPAQGAATDAPWKVGISETSRGQAVTGTMVGRKSGMTGDEASTCRTVTGTEYMGADVFRDFCQAEPAKSFSDMGTSKTSRGNGVTGNKVGRSKKVTGDEPGSCKNVTGTEYLSAGQMAACGTEPGKSPAKITGSETRGGKSVTGNLVDRKGKGASGKVTGGEVGADRQLTGTQYMQRDTTKDRPKAPAKVGTSATLRGGSVTGTMVGRQQNMTGDEAGSCRNVTGDDYIGQEQFGAFCDSKPEPKDRKVGVSATLSGERVTGTMTGRGGKVTGDEPGTCKAVTGTPYAGAEQYGAFCEPDQAKAASARMESSKRMFGSVMTGIQPSVGGVMTGDEKGACEPVTGTPYVGADQAAGACAATAADIGAPDFPQPLFNGQPWTQFSVGGPAHASEAPQRVSGVTGASYEGNQHVTGPFGMAGGKVTGTEEMRFGSNKPGRTEMAAPAEAPMVDGRVKTRVTGEGISAGLKITGDDWDRGDRVTGTEGMSAQVRNPSRRGPQQPMASAMAQGRSEATPQPVSKVTGASGNYEGGSLITFSGGARG
ncbi:MAG: carboxysome shell protein [Gammaproteobacteria bacterium]|nr:carboxysome shell protein [Gammaproteobacteria bacterium]MCP5135213.1 carboxysome shell protein [Gammaproteobacteria bacterium]